MTETGEARSPKGGETRKSKGAGLCSDSRCEHPKGWHRHGTGSCLECGCVEFKVAPSLFARLAMWSTLGLIGCAAVIGCGLTGYWIGFVVGLVWANAATFMLGTGLWMRWPRG